MVCHENEAESKLVLSHEKYNKIHDDTVDRT